jgi:hypothetical protein
MQFNANEIWADDGPDGLPLKPSKPKIRTWGTEVEEALAGKLSLIGGEMAGDIAMALHRITGLAAPSASADAATKAYVDALLVGAALFQDVWDASVGTFPSATAKKGNFWVVSVAGTVNGVSFSVGDSIYARVDNPGNTTYAGKWQKLEGSLTLAEVQAAVGFTFGSLASLSSVTASLISDASANGRSFIMASNYAAMKSLLAIAAADITDASANGRSLLTAVNYAAMKALLSIAAGDVSGLGAAATLGLGAGLSSSGGNIVAAVQSVATLTGAITASGLKTALAITESDVSGLVADLASKADASAVTSALAAKAPLASPTFTGTPAAPTPTANDNSTKIATTAYVDAAVSGAGGFTAAAAADLWTGTNNAKGATAKAIADAEAWVDIADAATMTPDFTAGKNFRLAPAGMAGNRTLAFPSAGLIPGREIMLAVKQDGTGSRTLNVSASGYCHDGDTAFVIGTAASKWSFFHAKVLTNTKVLLQLVAVNVTVSGW